MRKKCLSIISLVLLTSFLQSCEKEHNIIPSTPTQQLDADAPLRKQFGQALSKALQSDAQLRDFIKSESLKKFNKDYDILYQMVKDKPIANGETFYQRISHHIDPIKLDLIERKMPLLTIFIPTLPSGFSPETWQTDQQIPKVAIRIIGKNAVPLYNGDGQEETIEPGLIPGFPVIVVKDNERVKLIKDGSNSFFTTHSFSFAFTDECFNGINVDVANRIAVNGTWSGSGRIAQRAITAYEIQLSSPNTQWQRDYIYYGITPSTPKGRLNDDFRETIRSIKLTNSGITKMSIAGAADDPFVLPVGATLFMGPGIWMDGDFEFRITVLNNPKDGTAAQQTVLFGAKPAQLYQMQFTEEKRSIFGPTYYTVVSLTPIQHDVNYSIGAWDLQNYSTAWSYTLMEDNVPVTTTKQETRTVEYAANFEFDPTFTGFIKGGAKFGISGTITKQNVTTLSYTVGSTELGEQKSYFYDPVVLGPYAPYGGASTINGHLYGIFDTYDLSFGGTAGYGTITVEPYSVNNSANDIP